MSGSASVGAAAANCSLICVEQIERHAVVGDPLEVGVGGRQIGHAERPQPGLGRFGIIQTRAKAVDVDHDSA